MGQTATRKQTMITGKSKTRSFCSGLLKFVLDLKGTQAAESFMSRDSERLMRKDFRKRRSCALICRSGVAVEDFVARTGSDADSSSSRRLNPTVASSTRNTS